jgi:hypothetical protein
MRDHPRSQERRSAEAERFGPPLSRAVETRHGGHYAAMGSAVSVEALRRHGGVARLIALHIELDNLIAGCRRAVTRGDEHAAVGCYAAAAQVLAMRGPFAVSAELGRAVLGVAAQRFSRRRIHRCWRVRRVREASREDKPISGRSRD